MGVGKVKSEYNDVRLYTGEDNMLLEIPWAHGTLILV